ncbi:MAG TPA: polysaccharide biosynthesis/export family protein [Thermoanaerobaculia bacterium]|nr:polysaccharide biosynthesis/export family protein [Thermoanaerobaculia bacterium]
MRALRPTFAIACLLASLAAAPPAAAQSAPITAAPVASSGYRLGPQDLVRVEVLESPGLTGERRVDSDGTIDLPPLGRVQAEGKTAPELAADIEQRLEADFLERATVRVDVLELRSKTVTIIGAVTNPGTFGFPGAWTLLEAITAAGGLSGERGGVVRVLRRADNGLSDQVEIALDDLVGRADPGVNLPLLPGDLVNVARSQKVTIYFLGEVAGAGALEFVTSDRVTLLAAIARAGGLTDRASPRIRIRRATADGRGEEIEVHYGRILAGRDPDVELRDGDLIVIKESFF